MKRIRTCILPCITLAHLFVACKTSSGSDPKALPIADIESLTLDQWVEACEQELSQPETAAAARADLLSLAATTNCEAAYPIVKKIVERYGK